MIVEVFMPKMTDNMSVGLVSHWLVKEGEHVERGQAILEVETDKVTMELEASDTGIIKGIRKGIVPGTEVPVGEILAFIVDDVNLDVPFLSSFKPSDNINDDNDREEKIPDAQPSKQSPLDDETNIQATPVVRRIARDKNIDLAKVKGTGPGGRITKEDILSFVESNEIEDIQSSTDMTAEWLELNRTQLITGRRMTDSVLNAPQFAITVSVDMTNVLKMQESLISQIQAETGVNLSITAILVKIVSGALVDCPRVNASFIDNRIKLYGQVNIGVAVGTDEGLVVPVIRDANNKTLAQVAQELHAYREKAKRMRFSADDLTGGTFTISNIGMMGIEQFQAIINPPESAILAIGQILKTPVGMPDDSIVLRPLMKMTLTADHRSLDGVLAAEFLSLVKERLQDLT